MFTMAMNSNDFQETSFDAGKLADEYFFGSRCNQFYQYVVDYNSTDKQTYSNANYLDNLFLKFTTTLSKTNFTSSTIFQKIFSFGETSIELIDSLQYQSASVSVVTSDTVVFKINLTQNLEIIIVKTFDELDEDDDPIVTLLEGKSIIFQNRLSVKTLVENIFASSI
jgi:hypothetical protein